MTIFQRNTLVPICAESPIKPYNIPPSFLAPVAIRIPRYKAESDTCKIFLMPTTDIDTFQRWRTFHRCQYFQL